MEEGNENTNENFEDILEDEVVEEIALPLPVMEDETRHFISTMMACEVSGENSTTIMKVVLMVEYGGHQIFMATLVSQLNDDVLLSKDMLTQVKILIYFNNKDDYIKSSSHPFPCWSD